MATPTYSQLAEQVLAIKQQASALATNAAVLLRTLQPLVEAEQDEQAAEEDGELRGGRRVFGSSPLRKDNT